MPVLFTDITSIGIVLFIVFALLVIGLVREKLDFLMLVGGSLAVYVVSAIATNGYVITSTVFDPNTSTFINQTSDNTIYLLVFGLLAICNFAVFAKGRVS